jgi:hypothetical protein
MTRALLAAFALSALCCLLAGCGGGGDDDEATRNTQPVDCKAHPEQCK